MSEVKVVEDERGQRLQAVGWRLMENSIMKPHLRESYWLSPRGVKFRDLDSAWKAHLEQKKETPSGLVLKPGGGPDDFVGGSKG